MGRLGRAALGASLWLVRLLTVGAALALLLVVWLIWGAGREPRLEPQPVAPPHQWPSRPAAAPAPPAPPPAPAEAPEPRFRGTTRFVRRLEAGAELNSLVGHGNDEDAWRRFEPLEPLLLRADGEEWQNGNLIYALYDLTHPPRDLGAVRLFEPAPDDPLGRDKAVRVWTLGAGYARGEVERAERMLQQIASVTGTRVGRGFDVLVTPEKGCEVFPRQHQVAWAAGIYYPADGYAVVRSGCSPSFREEVLKHELVHAYCNQYTGSFESSRCVSEGLAEYLRHCAPGDDGFAVPAHLLRDDMAGLLALLERLRERGLDPSDIRPGRLVMLSPSQFYALRHLAYAMAKACVAFVGAEVLEQAFREESDRAIVAAIRKIDMAELLAWLKKVAEGGSADRALTVADVPPAGEADEASLEAQQAALRWLGLKVEDDRLIDLDLTFTQMLSEPGQVAAVLAALGADEREVTLFADASPSMDREVAVRQLPEGVPWLVAERLRQPTPRLFVGTLFDELRRGRVAGVITLTLPPGLGMGALSVSDEYRFDPVFKNLDGREDLVFCVTSGSPKDVVIRGLARTYKRLGHRPHAVLVIDFAPGASDGGDLVRFYAALGGLQPGLVAWWKPLE